MGAETYSPPTSVHRGSAFMPPALVAGSPNGLGDHLEGDHTAPGESHVLVLDVGAGALPSPATARGKLVRFTEAGSSKLAISDGAAWRYLTVGSII